MSLLAVERTRAGHDPFRAWLTAAEPGPPSAEIASHAVQCDECRSAVAALDALRAIDPSQPDLPAPSPHAQPEAPIWAWARYAAPLVVILVLAVVRPDIGAVVAPQGDLFEAVADPEQGILGDWGSALDPDPATGGPTDEGDGPLPGAGGGSPQPSLAPGVVPSADATPPVGVVDPSSAPFTTGPTASPPGSLPPGSLPPGVTPPASTPASQPAGPTPPPSSDPTVPPPPPVTPEPTPLPPPPPTPEPTPVPPPPTPEPTPVPNPTGECADGIDNDGDLLVDLVDPGCLLGLRNSESLL
jgi:hypothetical protein